METGTTFHRWMNVADEEEQFITHVACMLLPILTIYKILFTDQKIK